MLRGLLVTFCTLLRIIYFSFPSLCFWFVPFNFSIDHAFYFLIVYHLLPIMEVFADGAASVGFQCFPLLTSKFVQESTSKEVTSDITPGREKRINYYFGPQPIVCVKMVFNLLVLCQNGFQPFSLVSKWLLPLNDGWKMLTCLTVLLSS